MLKNNTDIRLFNLVKKFNDLNDKKLKVVWDSQKIIKQKIYKYKRLNGWKPIKSNINNIINLIKN